MHGRRDFAKTFGLSLLVLPAFASARTGTGSITGAVTLTRRGRAKQDHSGVVIYVEGPKVTLPAGKSYEIRQIDRHFRPALSVVTVGTTLTFPNDDNVFHNVFSNSSAAKFDLGSYDNGETRSVRLKKPGQVEVYCNIHEQMRATVLVLDTTYYARTDRSGTFVIKDVPAGSHRYMVWQRDGKPTQGRVTVVEGAPARINLEVEEGRPTRHRKKTGHAYPNY
jgi:plastocyanin